MAEPSQKRCPYGDHDFLARDPRQIVCRRQECQQKHKQILAARRTGRIGVHEPRLCKYDPPHMFTPSRRKQVACLAKECRAKHAHEHYERLDKERHRKTQKAYNAAHREILNKSSRGYYSRNKEAHNKRVKNRMLQIRALAAKALAAENAQKGSPGRKQKPDEAKQFFIIGTMVERKIGTGKELTAARQSVAKDMNLSYSTVAQYHKQYKKSPQC